MLFKTFSVSVYGIDAHPVQVEVDVKVSRTVARLDVAAEVRARHLSEAIQYRTLDRDYRA